MAQNVTTSRSSCWRAQGRHTPSSTAPRKIPRKLRGKRTFKHPAGRHRGASREPARARHHYYFRQVRICGKPCVAVCIAMTGCRLDGRATQTRSSSLYSAPRHATTYCGCCELGAACLGFTAAVATRFRGAPRTCARSLGSAAPSRARLTLRRQPASLETARSSPVRMCGFFFITSHTNPLR